MTNATSNLTRHPYGKGGREVHLPVDGGSKIYEGTLVSQLNATAMLVAGSTASSGAAVGVSKMYVDNSAGSDGDKRCVVETDQVFSFPNATGGGDPCSEATKLFSVVYMTDDHTVADNSSSGTRQAAGRFMGMNEDGTVRVFVGMANLSDSLAAATDVSITDTGAFTATGNVEDALQEIYQHLKTAQASIPISLYDWREVTSAGDVGAIAANGGILASDTTPIMRGDAAESAEISWAATNVDPISCHITLPTDFDGSANATLDLFVYTDNAGGGGIDAATFTTETSWDGGALVSNAATDGTPATAIHKITATIAAASIPDTASLVTIALTPAAHANDPTQLVGARLNYKRKLLTS
jgi:hypothetical protein